MKPKLLLPIIAFLLATNVVNAQFSRNFLTTTPPVSNFGTKLMKNPSGNLKLISLHPTGTASNYLFKISEINALGDLINVTDIPLNIPEASSNAPMLSNCFETSSDYLISFLVKTNSIYQAIIFVKINKSTLAVTQTYTAPEAFRLGYSETQLFGNQLVTYMVKSTGGLYRVSVAGADFTSYTTELVDATITLSGGNASIIQGKTSVETALVGGKEVSVMALIDGITIYTRDAANSYSPLTVSTSSDGGNHLTSISNDTLLACDAVHWYRINNNTVVSAGPFLTGSNSTQFVIAKHPEGFYRVTKIPGQDIRFETYDLNFNLLTSGKYLPANPVQFAVFNDKPVFLGATVFNLVDADFDGNTFQQAQAFVHSISGTLTQQLPQEYQTAFAKDDLHFRFSESSKMITGPQGNLMCGISYNDTVRIGYLMHQLYNGINANGDTLGQSESPYTATSIVGPYTDPALYDEIVESKFNRGFYVTKAMIEQHIDSIQSNSSTYVPVHGIREWPGNGNVTLGQSADLAPFIDLNSNGIYEPMDGEYPVIYGDECLLQIWHDHPQLAFSGGVETHAYAYTLNCDTSDIFDNSVFFKIRLFARENDLFQFNLGTYLDPDTGNPLDDYVGTHAELGMVYAYNGDLYDDPFGSEAGFGEKPPVQGFMVLKGNKKDDDGVDNPEDASATGCTNGLGFNDGIVDNEYFTLERSMSTLSTGVLSDPNDVGTWMRLTQGFWADGTPMFYGGNGNINLSSSTTIKARFIYPGGSDTLFYGTGGVNPGFDWTAPEPSGTGSTALPKGDYRVFTSHGTRTFHQSDTLEFEYVYLIYSDTSVTQTGLGDLLPGLFDKAEKIKHAYQQNEGPCQTDFDPIDGDLTIDETKVLEIGVYPNPTTGTVRLTGTNGWETTVGVYDASGRVLKTVVLTSDADAIDLSDLQGTLFFLKIQQGASFTTKKVIRY